MLAGGEPSFQTGPLCLRTSHYSPSSSEKRPRLQQTAPWPSKVLAFPHFPRGSKGSFPISLRFPEKAPFCPQTNHSRQTGLRQTKKQGPCHLPQRENEPQYGTACPFLFLFVRQGLAHCVALAGLKLKETYLSALP